MSAEQLVEDIITRALEVAADKADAADEYSERAISAARSVTWVDRAGFSFTPANIEPKVNIPTDATGVDGSLYDSTYQQIIADLSDKFAGFFDQYFPNECNYLAKAQEELCDMLNGGSGIPAHVEDQIWQRDRARVLVEVNRVRDETLATFAARGFPLPPGAAAHTIHLAQTEAQNKIAQQSRDVAIKHVEILIENIKFAIQQALDYRVKGIQAAGDYIKTLAVGPEIAMRLATSAADAQAQLINAASSYYRNRIAVEELKLDVLKTNSQQDLQRAIANLEARVGATRALSETLSQAARAAGDQAAAALNAVHGSAQVAVQGETA